MEPYCSTSLRLSKFAEEDFPEYRSWYDDAELNLRLGPMDDEWLECVLNETDGRQYSVFEDEELVAVIGVTFPAADHPACFITDLAVKPSRRRHGIGSRVLAELMTLHRLEPGQTWNAVVDVKNAGARRFLEKNGWRCVTPTPDAHGMLALEIAGRLPSGK